MEPGTPIGDMASAPFAATTQARHMHFSFYRAQAGYTYLLVLFVIAGLGLFVAQAGVVWQQVVQREREEDLISVGKEFSHALTSYRQASPAGVMPESLTQLIEDKRSGLLRRHLRRIYRDPLTGVADWGVVRVGGRIAGVYSLAQGVPIRHYDLPPELGNEAAGAQSYSQWIFQDVAQDGSVPRFSGSLNAP